MSWIHKLGRFSSYRATNLAGKTICKKTLNREIQNIIASPAKNIPSVVAGREFYGDMGIDHHAPSYKNPHIYSYSYMKKSDYKHLHSYNLAKEHWKNVPIEDKLGIFDKIADLVENKYFYQMMAATMVGQGKNIYEAELDCIAETVDFLRFNIQYTTQIMEKQPLGENNYSQYLPLQGRVAAITPFNFTAIAANLSTAPLYFGNVVYWKPSEKSLLSNYLYYQICLEAGIPPEVLNFVLMKPQDYISEVMRNKTGGVLFTGSSNAFINILSSINYKELFPRIIGETGGKNYHFVEESADLDLVVEKTYQSAFGYSGQKCSACSIIYLPDIMYHDFVERINTYHNEKHPQERENYCLIDKCAYNRTVHVLKNITNKNDNSIVMGGNYNTDNGYYVEPTVVRTVIGDPLLKRELFAPILKIRAYPPIFKNMAIVECANNSEYKLTGAIFSRNEDFINSASKILDGSCGNFYINDKSTGSVVGQQPFGGFGMSGTNDKAGDINFMMRLFSQRNIKY